MTTNSNPCCSPHSMTHTGDDAVDLSRLLSVIAQPGRLRLLQAILAKGSCITSVPDAGIPPDSDLMAESLHSLREVGIIQGVITGDKHCFCINNDTLRWLRAALERCGLTLIPTQNTPLNVNS